MPAPALFDPQRHEPLAGAPWSDAAARLAIRAIVDEAMAAFTPQGLWLAHPLDEPPAPDTRWSMLYMGAGGVICALRELAALGHAPRMEFDDVVPTLLDRNRACGETRHGAASYLMGDSGLLLLQWKVHPSQAVADRLFEVVRSNLDHPAREPLWGSPGSLLAAVHMAEATGDARWAQLLNEGASRLVAQMAFDEGLHAWVWRQDLYGRTRCFLGAGHGLVGNAYTFLRAAPWLPASVVATVTERTWDTLDACAIRAGGAANWHAVYDPPLTAGRLPLVQDCHGAPGVVVRLAAGVPRTPAWDAMLAAAGELTWRAGPLRKGANLCHGTAGNGFAFLKLWERSGDPTWLDRARAFAMHAIRQVDDARREHGRGRHSLWTGDAGTAIFLARCIDGNAAFPTLDKF